MASQYQDVAGVGLYELEIESVSLPVDGIRTNVTGHTTYTIIVKIRSGVRHVVRKRYSEMRGFHTDLKSSHAQVKQLKFPSKFMTPSSTFQEKRRRGLDEYFRALLNIDTVPHRELLTFLDVNANAEEFECVEGATPTEVEYSWNEVVCDEVLKESNDDGSHADSDGYLEFSSQTTLSNDSSIGHPVSVDESYADSDGCLEFSSQTALSIDFRIGHPPSVDESPLTASCTWDPDDLYCHGPK